MSSLTPSSWRTPKFLAWSTNAVHSLKRKFGNICLRNLDANVSTAALKMCLLKKSIFYRKQKAVRTVSVTSLSRVASATSRKAIDILTKLTVNLANVRSPLYVLQKASQRCPSRQHDTLENRRNAQDNWTTNRLWHGWQDEVASQACRVTENALL